MTEEAYVSFECARLLKEKGFSGECLSMYVTPKPHSGMGNPNEAKLAPHGRDSHYYEGYLYQCEAPTQQIAMRWLREVYDLLILIEVVDGDIITDDQKYYYVWIYKDRKIVRKKGLPLCYYSTYEEACEAAIKYCLKNLI